MLWAELSINAFFKDRTSPSRKECDQVALQLTGASSIQSVSTPGSLSYTIICSNADSNKTILSFREQSSVLDGATLELAVVVHGHLVPSARPRGEMPSSDPKLFVYEMPLLPGCALVDMLEFEETLDPTAEARQLGLVADLACYFARCWNKPQSANDVYDAQLQEQIRRRLEKISQQSIIPNDLLHELDAQLLNIFGVENHRVLTHCDLSETNILVDADAGHITGIVDWSLAKTMPFGLELDALLLLSGYRDMAGWHDYTCRQKLLSTFWDISWNLTGTLNDQRVTLLKTFNAAARIGALLRYAFRRTQNGSPTMELLPTDKIAQQAYIW